MITNLFSIEESCFSRRCGTAHLWAVPLSEWLESNSQTELNCARRVHLRCHNAEGWSAYLLVGRAESYMIERIKEFRCELQIHTLRDVVAFCDGEIPVVHVIHANGINVSGRVAEPDLAGSIHRLEAGRVEPAIGCATSREPDTFRLHPDTRSGRIHKP